MSRRRNWQDLPQVVQLEIFTFLSVKHFGKIMSLNKSIHQQLDESEYFWQQLCINYARVLQDQNLIEKTKTLQNDQTEINKHEKYSKHFEFLIKEKEAKIKTLEAKKLADKQIKQLEQLKKLRNFFSFGMTSQSPNESNETKKDEFDFEKELAKLKFD